MNTIHQLLGLNGWSYVGMRKQGSDLVVVDYSLLVAIMPVAIFFLLDAGMRFFLSTSVLYLSLSRTDVSVGQFFYLAGLLEVTGVLGAGIFFLKKFNFPRIASFNMNTKIFCANKKRIDLGKALGLDFGETTRGATDFLVKTGGAGRIKTVVNPTFNLEIVARYDGGQNEQLFQREESRSNITKWSIFISEVNLVLGGKQIFVANNQNEFRKKSNQLHTAAFALFLTLMMFSGILFMFIINMGNN
jgi:hypothetical protein